VKLLEDRINRQGHLVARNLAPEIMNNIRTRALVAYATKRDSWARGRSVCGTNEGGGPSAMEYCQGVRITPHETWGRILPEGMEGKDPYRQVLTSVRNFGPRHLISLGRPLWYLFTSDPDVGV
jgi:hypothetical protein